MNFIPAHLWLRVWQSPTLTTWTSLLARSLGLILVLPLVLRQFSPQETALWQIFSVLFGLQLFIDFGFGPTLTRLIAYAMGGMSDLRTESSNVSVPGRLSQPNWALLARVAGTTRFLYWRMALVLCVLLGGAGTWLLIRPIATLQHAPGISTSVLQAWVAWIIVWFATVINFGSGTYTTFLQGTNHVALVRRWDTIFNVLAAISSYSVLMWGGGLLALVISNQSWTFVSAGRNCWLSRQVLHGRFRRFPSAANDPDVFQVAWPASWRSGVGVLIYHGLIQVSALVYAQSRDTVAVASYMLGLRLIYALNQISQAPFYSQLPGFASLYAQGDRSQLVALAKRRMAWAYWAFIIPFLGLGFFGRPLLHGIHSQTPFPSDYLWALLGFAILLERCGAMHMQLYGTSNKILWHIGNGGSGSIFLVVAVLAYPSLGIVALPLGILLGNLLFYAPYAIHHSHQAFGLSYTAFEFPTIGIPFLATMGYVFYVFLK